RPDGAPGSVAAQGPLNLLSERKQSFVVAVCIANHEACRQVRVAAAVRNGERAELERIAEAGVAQAELIDTVEKLVVRVQRGNLRRGVRRGRHDQQRAG